MQILQTDIDTFQINSFTDPNQAYKVKIIHSLPDGTPFMGTCSCPHHTYRQAQCKHIGEIIKYTLDNGIKILVI